MKNNCLYSIGKMFRSKIVFTFLVFSAYIAATTLAIGQEDSSSKLSFSMNIKSIVSDGVRSLKLEATRKENRKIISVDDLFSPVNLYLNEVKEHDPVNGTGLIGKVYLNENGDGVFQFSPDLSSLTSGIHEYTFIAKVDSDPKYEDNEEQITVSDAKISIEYNGDDSIKTAIATLSAWKDNAYIPVPEAELKLGVKRLFSILPFGEEGTATDTLGQVLGELPLDIPGTPDKKLILSARIEDDETYGTIEITKVVPWAVLPKTTPERGRTLWSTAGNAPLLLVFASLTIIIIIWGTIFYLIYLLFKIRKISRQ